jgi:hypothetical protein
MSCPMRDLTATPAFTSFAYQTKYWEDRDSMCTCISGGRRNSTKPASSLLLLYERIRNLSQSLCHLSVAGFLRFPIVPGCEQAQGSRVGLGFGSHQESCVHGEAAGSVGVGAGRSIQLIGKALRRADQEVVGGGEEAAPLNLQPHQSRPQPRWKLHLPASVRGLRETSLFEPLSKLLE